MQAKIDDGSLDLDYVIINNTKDNSLYRGFVGIFHTWDCLYYNGEEWVFGPIEDNFRECLKYLNSLYEAGYIDLSLQQQTSIRVRQKLPQMLAVFARHFGLDL